MKYQTFFIMFLICASCSTKKIYLNTPDSLAEKLPPPYFLLNSKDSRSNTKDPFYIGETKTGILKKATPVYLPVALQEWLDIKAKEFFYKNHQSFIQNNKKYQLQMEIKELNLRELPGTMLSEHVRCDLTIALILYKKGRNQENEEIWNAKQSVRYISEASADVTSKHQETLEGCVHRFFIDIQKRTYLQKIFKKDSSSK